MDRSECHRSEWHANDAGIEFDRHRSRKWRAARTTPRSCAADRLPHRKPLRRRPAPLAGRRIGNETGRVAPPARAGAAWEGYGQARQDVGEPARDRGGLRPPIPDHRRCAAAGRGDAGGAPRLDRRSDRRRPAAPHHPGARGEPPPGARLLLDLSEVTFLDQVGLDALLHLQDTWSMGFRDGRPAGPVAFRGPAAARGRSGRRVVDGFGHRHAAGSAAPTMSPPDNSG